MQCTIEGISHNGEGVARINNKVVFIPFAIPGDTIEIKITRESKRYSRGEIIEVLSESTDRTKPACPHFNTCGGCVYQHAKYQAQLAFKHRVVCDNLCRIAKLTYPVNPVLGMDDPWRYRNKVTWHVIHGHNPPALGFYQYHKKQLLSVVTCKLISAQMESTSHKIKELMGLYPVPNCTDITIRHSNTGQILVIFQGSRLERLPEPLMSSLQDHVDSIFMVNQYQTIRLFGKESILERIGSIYYQVSPLSFFQVNPLQTQVLFDLIRELAASIPDARVLDAYCGIGAISLYIADRVNHVLGIEAHSGAVKDARMNACLNNITNCSFITGRCENVLADLNQEFDVIIVDPPRAGCDKKVLEAIVHARPQKIIYVSCNPATLARDLAILEQSSYAPHLIQPIDMFPQTGHVETVVVMSSVKG